MTNCRSLPIKATFLSVVAWLHICSIHRFLLPQSQHNLRDPLLFGRRRVRESVMSLGYCFGNESLLFPEIGHDVCRFSTCLIGKKGQAISFELEAKSWETLLQTRKNYEQCVYPSGGQVQFEGGRPGSLSIIFTVRENLLSAARNILRVYLTMHEVDQVELLVIDDGSLHHGDSLQNLLSSLEYQFNATAVYTRNSCSMGFGPANNKGLKQARGEFVVLINSDVVVLPGWLALLVWTKQNFPNAGIVGPLMLQNDGRVSEAGGLIFHEGITSLIDHGLAPHKISMKHAHAVDYISGACILFERKKFIGFGLFDPAYYPAYYEDTDAAAVFYKNGYISIIQPLAVVVHQIGGSYSTSERTSLMERNRLVFSSKHRDMLFDFCRFPGYSPHLNTFRASIVTEKQGRPVIVLAKNICPMDLDQSSPLFQILIALRGRGFAVTVALEQFDSSLDQRGTLIKFLARGIVLIHIGEQKNLFCYAADPGEVSTEPKHCTSWSAVFVYGLDMLASYKKLLYSIRRKTPLIAYPFCSTANISKNRAMGLVSESRGNNIVGMVPEYIQGQDSSLFDGIDCVLTVAKKRESRHLGVRTNLFTPRHSTRIGRETTNSVGMVASFVIILNACEEQNRRTISWLLNETARLTGSFSSRIVIAGSSQICTQDRHKGNASPNVGRSMLLRNSQEALAALSNARAVVIFQTPRDLLATQAINVSAERGTPLFIPAGEDPVLFLRVHPCGPATLLTGNELLDTLKKIFAPVQHKNKRWSRARHGESVHLPSIGEELGSCLDELGLSYRTTYKCPTSAQNN